MKQGADIHWRKTALVDTPEQRLVVETVLKEISDVVNSIDDSQQVLDNLSRMVARMLKVRRCSLMLMDPDKRRLLIRAAHGIPRKVVLQYRARPGDGIAGWVLRERKPLLITDVESHPLFQRPNRREYTTRSLLSVPLMVRGRAVGVLNVNNKADGGVFTKSDELLLGVVANFMVIALDKARLREVVLEKERIDEDLRVAREIQRGILPADLPSGEDYELAGRCIPAREVAGDFYDLIELPDDRLCLLLGDVCGKGVPAALYMTRVLSYFRALANVGRSAENLLASVNELLAAEWSEHTLVTACALVLEKRDHTMLVANAGHLPPYLYRTGSDTLIPLLSEGSFPLGIEAGTEFETERVRLEPGDVTLLYTDGITEALNPNEELFGEERLREVLRSHRGSAEELVEAVIHRVLDFTESAEQSDDQTLVVVRKL
jgi:sigma-B regulation protein RsbU (phosphoserine phosphatase)